MKKMVLLAAVAALFVGMLAVPASAAKTEVGAFRGVANVGSTFNKDCTQQGDATAIGKGLYLPGENDHNGTYSLNTTVVSAPNGAGTLKVCGLLGAGGKTNMGASCGSSRGHSGKGKLTWDSKPGLVYQLNNVGWWQSVGGTLYVDGDVTEAFSNKSKTGKNAGWLRAVVQAQGGDGCLETKPSDGATVFQVAGTFTASNTLPEPPA